MFDSGQTKAIIIVLTIMIMGVTDVLHDPLGVTDV